MKQRGIQYRAASCTITAINGQAVSAALEVSALNLSYVGLCFESFSPDHVRISCQKAKLHRS